MEDKMTYHDRFKLLMEICLEHNLSIVGIGHKYIRLKDNIRRGCLNQWYPHGYSSINCGYEVNKCLEDDVFEALIKSIKKTEDEKKPFSEIPIQETYSYKIYEITKRHNEGSK